MKSQLSQIARATMRAYTRDNAMLTFDGSRATVMDGSPLWRQGMQIAIAAGMPIGYGASGGGRGGVITHDGRTVDSTGAFLVGELERLDLTLNEPLAAVTWGRDIDLREDVTVADEVSSFTLTTFAANGGPAGGGQAVGTGKAWMGKSSDQITGLGVDISKVPHALTPWGMEIKFSILELESAAKIGRPIDQQKYEGLQLKHQMDVDEMVYIGDTTMAATGLINDALVVPQNVVAGAAGFTLWDQKTPDEILTDVNTALSTVWEASAWAVMPGRLLLPPKKFGAISTRKVSEAGNMSILKYLQENNLLTTTGRGKLDIQPLKWLQGAGAGGTIGLDDGHDRMVVYTKDKKRVRYPMTLLQRTPIQYDSVYHKSTYFCRLGQVEMPYPETVGYFDGL